MESLRVHGEQRHDAKARPRFVLGTLILFGSWSLGFGASDLELRTMTEIEHGYPQTTDTGR